MVWICSGVKWSFWSSDTKLVFLFDNFTVSSLDTYAKLSGYVLSPFTLSWNICTSILSDTLGEAFLVATLLVLVF